MNKPLRVGPRPALPTPSGLLRPAEGDGLCHPYLSKSPPTGPEIVGSPRLDAKNDVARVSLIKALVSLGEAEGVIEKAVELSPEDPRAYTALGMVQAKERHLQQSIQAFRKVISLTPASIESRLNVGVALGDGLNTPAALAEFNEAVRLAPHSAAAHYNRGRVLFDLNRYDEAQS